MTREEQEEMTKKWNKVLKDLKALNKDIIETNQRVKVLCKELKALYPEFGLVYPGDKKKEKAKEK